MTGELFDAGQLDQFADRIRKSPNKAETAFIEALNKGGEFARQRGVDKIHSELNLTRSYVEKHLQITRQAQPGDLRTVISGRVRPTTLYRYGGNKIATAPARSARRKLKGDKRRGIARGQKAAGIQPFRVKRSGSSTKWAGGFIVFLKRGDARSGNIAMAIRTGKGRDDWRVVYGPSVGSAWKNVRRDVNQEALEVVGAEFQKAFTRIF